MNLGVPLESGLRPVRGFEQTAYAWQGDALVWRGHSDGRAARVRHPRHLHAPWRAAPRRYAAARLQAGALALRAWVCAPTAPAWVARGLLRVLRGEPLDFPFAAAAPWFEAIATALQAGESERLRAAALRVLGLGPGLTPSGDDFLGGVFFALHHAPDVWRGDAADLAGVRQSLRVASAQATNPISAALLADLLDGQAYSSLHALLDALHDGGPAAQRAAVQELLSLGASSGADLLAGVLVALTPPAAPDLSSLTRPQSE